MFTEMLPSSSGGGTLQFITKTVNVTTSVQTITVSELTHITGMYIEYNSSKMASAIEYQEDVYDVYTNPGAGASALLTVSGNTFDIRWNASASFTAYIVGF